MSINKLISIKNPILDAQNILGIDHDKDVPLFTRLATLAEKEIGSYFQYERKQKVIEICGCSANLPNDSVLVEVAAMGDLGENCGDLLRRVCGITGTTTNLSDNVNFLVVDIGGSVGEEINIGTVNYSIQNNKIIFDSDRDGQFITVQYLRYKTDCDGFMEIGENHVNAIRWYIIWHHYLGKKNKNYIDRDSMREAKAEWERECRHARAEDGRMTQSQREEAARLYSNPMTGRGLTLGMTPTNYRIW